MGLKQLCSANLFKTLGPGLLWAGAAVGVSHLVQSTRAGATYGFELIWMILLINLFKYPFFEFAPRYAVSTGESLLDGYKRLGKWAVILYLFLTLLTMFSLMAAITAVTAGMFSNIVSSEISIFWWFVIILGVATALVSSGRYSVLDVVIKFIIVLLAVSSIVAVVAAFGNGYHPQPAHERWFNWQLQDIALLIAFAGWMPTAIDISVWHSLWTLAKAKESGYRPKLRESLFDYNVGYIGTAVLSLGFLSLGALVMYGTGEEFSKSGTQFAGQLIHLFTANLGTWSYYLIAIAALTTMASTTITCLDAYPRVLKPTTLILFPKLNKGKTGWIGTVWLIILLSGTLIIAAFFMSSMQFLVDLATTLSFLTAPLLGYMNYKVVTARHVPPEARPPKWLRWLSWLGLVVLAAFGIYYLIWRFVIG